LEQPLKDHCDGDKEAIHEYAFDYEERRSTP
jgi:hypothetical protein